MRCPFCDGDIEIPGENEPAFCISCGARQVDPEMEPEEDEWLRGDRMGDNHHDAEAEARFWEEHYQERG